LSPELHKLRINWPVGQMQWNSFWPSMHVPPFWQGFERHSSMSRSQKKPLKIFWSENLNSFIWRIKLEWFSLKVKALVIFWANLKLSCDSRFQRAFTACVCIVKVIMLVWANQGNYFENENARWKRLAQLSLMLCQEMLPNIFTSNIINS
jgi:hypothetical protein